MRENRPGYKSMSRFAWLAPTIILLAAGLIYLFGNTGADSIHTEELTGTHERLRIGDAGQYDGLPQATIALSAGKRQRVLQNLSGFRAEHQMVGPTVTVVALQLSTGSRELAQRIGGILAQYNLGDTATDPVAGDDISSGNAGVILLARRADRTLAHNLLRALSPMLSGMVRIQFDDTQRPGTLLLGIAASPRFTAQGVAVFSSD